MLWTYYTSIIISLLIIPVIKMLLVQGHNGIFNTDYLILKLAETVHQTYKCVDLVSITRLSYSQSASIIYGMIHGNFSSVDKFRIHIEQYNKI